MSFDINAFLATSTSEPMATRPAIVPAGEYTARVADVESPDEIATKWIVAPRGNQTWPKLAIPFVLVDEALKATLGRTNVRVTSDFRLDVDSANRFETGNGKNVDLGRLRAALGQNIPGQAWTFSMLPGAGPVRVEVVHQPNKTDPDNPYVRVRRVIGPASA